MASNGISTGNSDYSYQPVGWTCQTLVTTPGNLNLGYDVKEPNHGLPKLLAVQPGSEDKEPKDAEVPEKAAASRVVVGGVYPHNMVGDGEHHMGEAEPEPVEEPKEEPEAAEPKAADDTNEGAS